MEGWKQVDFEAGVYSIGNVQTVLGATLAETNRLLTWVIRSTISKSGPEIARNNLSQTGT